MAEKQSKKYSTDKKNNKYNKILNYTHLTHTYYKNV